MLKEITVASALVALFVLSGCGGGGGTPSGGGNPPDTGIEIPDVLSQKVDINVSTAGKFMRAYYKNMKTSSASIESKLLVKGLGHIKSASQPARLGGRDSNVTIENQVCSEHGTFSFKRETNTVTEGDMNITTTVIECSANDCQMNNIDYDNNDIYIDFCEPEESRLFLGSVEPQEGDSIRTYNGSIKLNIKEGENANEEADPEKNSIEVTKKIVNLTYTRESDSSDHQRYKFANGENSFKGTSINSEDLHQEGWTWKDNYTYKEYDRNKTNTEQIFDGKTIEANINWVWNEEDNDTTHTKTIAVDGYILGYDISGSESNKTFETESFALDNVTFEKIREGNVTTQILDGGINDGTTCGKMLNITTDKIVKHNKTFSVSAGAGSSDVLPYAGKVTLKGNGVAKSTFNLVDENKTSMTLKVNDAAEVTYHKWSEVPNYNCDDDE